ncbi:formate dehydrogenase subunit beta [Carboxydochorda subterranea]|uniref:Formate dehydrogenase subunit beta n=1 Tax=Carboxydichorda subterranea TaxID=3109565 RepID=A0ABZ1BZH7_9FIRM|nr:formate dehydrogenase subunit beta [Limnochorda sp. L945t]WRP17960.1 formate dehydrogenase subunit beta [Limnochorda sp. L945t]
MANVLSLKRVSASSSPPPGVSEVQPVAKLIDVSRCIGCKGCEVACKEWNDLPPEPTHNFGSYQSHEDLSAQTWTLIRFHEVEIDGRLQWLMLKDQCMHCEDPGCLAACPSPGAIVQYANGIVDFNQDACIGCGYCITGCPFDVPRLSATTGKVYKCNLCVDRVSAGLEPACAKTCPTGAIQFGPKDQMLERARTSAERLKQRGYANAAVYSPQGVGGTHVIYVLPHGDAVEQYGLPKDPQVSPAVHAWKGILKTIGSMVMGVGLVGTALHYLTYGPTWAEGDKEDGGRREVTSVGRQSGQGDQPHRKD